MFTEHPNSTVSKLVHFRNGVSYTADVRLGASVVKHPDIKPSDSRIAFNKQLLKQCILLIKQRCLTSREEFCCRSSFFYYSICTVVYIQRVVKKCKYVLAHAMKAYKGRTSSTHSQPRHEIEVTCQAHIPDSLPLETLSGPTE
jgi:hypothetical protein